MAEEGESNRGDDIDGFLTTYASLSDAEASAVRFGTEDEVNEFNVGSGSADDIDRIFTSEASSLSDAKAENAAVRFVDEEEVDENSANSNSNNINNSNASPTSKTGPSLLSKLAPARLSSKSKSRRRFSSKRTVMRQSILARARLIWQRKYQQRRETSSTLVEELEEEERSHLESVLTTNTIFQDVVQRGRGSLNDLVAAFDRVEYDKGDVIFYQGDTDKDYLLIIQEGECSITIDGKEVPHPYGTLKKGAMVGELALLMDKDRGATVTAKTDVEAFRLDRADFKRFMAEELGKEDIIEEIREIDYIIDKISGVRNRYGGDIIRQFKPSRLWLWGKWHGTIVQQCWNEAAANMLVCAVFVAAVRVYSQPPWALGQIPDPDFPLISRLIGLSKLWRYLLSITTFVLTFFLAQAYTLWRRVYDTMRTIQGRVNDIGLLIASTVERDSQGKYTKRAEELLDDVGNYCRLFDIFCWACYSKNYKVLSTSRGMSRMHGRGLMSSREYNTLTSLSSNSGSPHHACLMWILMKCLTAMKDGTLLPNDRALRDILFNKVCDVRTTAACICEGADGRIQFGYVHFVQLLVDTFLIIAPFALYAELGVWSVPAVALLTLFYAGLLILAKILLDPLDNDGYYTDSAPVNVDLGVLIRECNAACVYWKYSAETLPFETHKKEN